MQLSFLPTFYSYLTYITNLNNEREGEGEERKNNLNCYKNTTGIEHAKIYEKYMRENV